MENQASIKKIVFITFGSVVFVIGLIWLWHYLHDGRIAITTNNPYASITITRTSGKSDASPTVFKGTGKLSVNTSTGDYSIMVKGNSRATLQLVKLTSHKTLSLEIDLVQTVGVEPVVYENAQDISADKNQLTYLNGSTGSIYRIASAGSPSLLTSENFQTVKWADSTFGVGQDSSGHLFSIENGSASQLKVPFAYDKATVSFALSSSKQIYISHGSIVYAGSQSGAFKQIYKSPSSSVALSASPHGVAITGEAFDVEDTTQKTELAVVSDSGKLTKKSVANIGLGQVGDLAWSSDGQYLVFPESQDVVIYDNSLHTISTLPANPGNVDWLDDNTFFYSYNDGLWRYSLGSQKAELLANMPLGSLITGLAISSDKSYVYLSTFGSGTGSTSAIRRVGLKNQSVPQFVYQLQSILPLDLGPCTLNLVNFAAPTILVESSAGESSQCQQTAKSELQQRGFDLNSLQFVPVT